MPNPIQVANAERQQGPLVLQASELALDRTPALVELADARSLSRDQSRSALTQLRRQCADPPRHRANRCVWSDEWSDGSPHERRTSRASGPGL